MIAVDEDIFPLEDNIQDNITGETVKSEKLNLLKHKINDEDYLFEAIQRIAQVLSNEITGIRGEKSARKR